MARVRTTQPAEKVKSISPDPPQTETTQPSLPRPEPLPDYDKVFKPIASYITECKPDVEWPIIEQWLKRSPKSVDEALAMLNEQPDMLVRSMRLYLMAKREFVRFEIDWKDRTEILRSTAREVLEYEKKERELRKQITNDMIEDWIIANYGDTYSAMKMRLQDMKNTRDLLEKLSSQVEAREPSLRRIVERMDGKKTPGFLTPQKRSGQ